LDNRFSDPQEVEELWSSLRRDAVRRGADAHTAEDVAQEAWLRALRRPPLDLARFRGWMHVVASRLLREGRRAQRHRSIRESEVARNERVYDLPDGAAANLRRYVEELPELYRTVVRLRFYEEREVEEIAEHLGLHPEAVRSRLKRGVMLLRQRIPPAERPGRSWLALAWVRRWFRGPWARPRWLPWFVVPATLLYIYFCFSLNRPALEVSVVRAEASEVAGTRPDVLTSLGSAGQVAVDSVDTDEEATSPLPPRDEPATRWRLEGVVRTPAGDPLPYARVHAAPPSAPGDETAVEADEWGRYAIEAAPLDLVWAAADDWCEGPHCLVATAPVPGDFDLFLSPTRGRATVLVLDHRDAPVPGAVVRLTPKSPRIETVSRRGTLEFPAPPSVVTCDAEGRAECVFPDQDLVELLLTSEGAPGQQLVKKTPPPGALIRTRLHAPLSLEGSCSKKGVPCPDARVQVRQFGGLLCREVRTGTDGTFRVESLSYGKYAIRAFDDPSLGAGSAYLEGVLQADIPPDVPALELDESSTLRGTVLVRGLAFAGASVALQAERDSMAEGDGWREGVTDESGRFAFPACAPETQLVCAWIQGTTRVGLLASRDADVRLDLGDGGEPRAPLELHLVGDAADLPQLIELRSPCSSTLLLEQESGAGRFRSAPVPASSFQVYAWRGDRGTQFLGTIEHEPRVARVQEFEMRPAGILSVALDLPEGFSDEIVVAEVEVPAMLAHGFRHERTSCARRELEWDAVRRTHSCRLPPGDYRLTVGGGKLATLTEDAHVLPGKETHLRLGLLQGRDTQIDFRSPRFLRRGEVLCLEAQTPHGPYRLELTEARCSENSFWFTSVVCLPLETSEVRARTRPAEGDDGLPLTGKGLVETLDQEPANGAWRLIVKLRDARE